MKRITLVFSVLLLGQLAFSQDTDHGENFSGKEMSRKINKYHSVTGGIFATQYLGDINPNLLNTFLNNRSTDIGISFEIDQQVTKQFALTGGISWIRLSADDFYLSDTKSEMGINHYIRNLSFRNDMFEFTFKTKFFFKKNGLSYQDRSIVNPYLFIGIGMVYQNPKARIPEFNLNNERNKNAGEWTSLRPLGTEGQLSSNYNIKTYSYFQPVIPIGIGLRIKLNTYIDMNFEASIRYTFTDYLDDVSGKYVDLGALSSELSKQMSYRSNEVNSSNGRNPRNFELIYNNTQPVVYNSSIDNNNYLVMEGFGNEGDQRGDGQQSDYYILTGIKITYVLTGHQKK